MMVKALTNTISYIFHPIFMPLLGVFLIFNSGTYLSYYPYEGQKAIFLIIILSMIVLPVCFIPMLFFFKMVKTIELNARRERILPYVFTLLFYYFAYFILKRAKAPTVVISMILASIITLSLTLIFSFRWKISAHMVGIGGLIGAMIALSSRMLFNVTFILACLILVGGFIGSSRLFLNAHKPGEIYAGFAIGIAASFLTVYYL